MSLYNSFQTDPSMEKTGIILDYGDNSKGLPMRIRVARAGGNNRKYATRLEALTKPVRTQINTDSLPRERSEAILRQVYADTVILGWENIEDRDGNPLDYSVENVVQLFSDLPDLFADVRKQADNWTLFRKEQNEDDSKNS